MNRSKRTFVAILAVFGFASVSMAGYSFMEDSILASADGVYDSAGTGWKVCGANCPNGWFASGYCLNTQSCCGWVSCSTNGNSSQNTCCNSGETCSDGRQCLPPCPPICN